MFKITSSTDLFGDAPQEPLINDQYDEYQKRISSHWKLQPTAIPEPQVEETPQKPQKITLDAPKTHDAILKGSQGSKIFSMLQKMKPSARPPEKINVKTPDSDPPRKKLSFSS